MGGGCLLRDGEDYGNIKVPLPPSGELKLLGGRYMVPRYMYHIVQTRKQKAGGRGGDTPYTSRGTLAIHQHANIPP